MITPPKPADIQHLFSQIVQYDESISPIELDLPNETHDTISLAYGDADPALFPVKPLIAAVDSMLTGNLDITLNYAPAYAGLIELVKERMARLHIPLTRSELMLANGSSQILSLLPQILCDPGDVIIVEGPTFLGAVETFFNCGLTIETIPVREDGMDLDLLESTLIRLTAQGIRAKFIYTIPTFQNPTGSTMPLANRHRLVGLAARFGVIIVEDDAYGDLHFDNPIPPKLIALDPTWVLYVGTFSKILAPGVRMAWACGPAEIIKRLNRFKTEGSNGPFMTRLVAQVSADGWLDKHIAVLNAHYNTKCHAMLNTIAETFPSDVRYNRPLGGFFVYVYLPNDLPVSRLLPAAIANGVSFLPGTTCYADGQGTHEIRLAFSFQSLEKVVEGIRRLGATMHQLRTA
ncbi:MAG: PLP-dependent aminotransferase family protein [Chloroflexales bacterium]|nr:PLP-dependent aminotransferase family protein [Chloroflexales bacterium]